MSFTVATYNILADAYANPAWYEGVDEQVLRAETRVPAIVRHVAGLHADILCLQEVEPQVFEALKIGLEPLNYVGHYEQKGQGRPDGSATFVRKDKFHVRTVKRLEYRDEMHNPGKHSGHVALLLVVEHEGRQLGVANTHIRWGDRSLPSTQQLGFRQVTELIEECLRLDQQRREWVVCGDFNFAPDSVVIAAMLGAGFGFAHAGRPHIRTAVANGQALLIDYVFHTAGLRPSPLDPPVVTDSTKLPSADLPSDHLALVSEFEWVEQSVAVPLGRYRHYKGNEYTVIGVARHSETQEELVVYRPEYGERGLWVRPKAMFLESVTVNGQTIPRFQFLG